METRTTTEAEERLIQAVLRHDELGQVGPVAENPDCCVLCGDQTGIREALDALKAERATT